MGWLTAEQLVWEQQCGGCPIDPRPSTYKNSSHGGILITLNVALWPEANREWTTGAAARKGRAALHASPSAYEALRHAIAAGRSGEASAVCRLTAPATAEFRKVRTSA